MVEKKKKGIICPLPRVNEKRHYLASEGQWCPGFDKSDSNVNRSLSLGSTCQSRQIHLS